MLSVGYAGRELRLRVTDVHLLREITTVLRSFCCSR